MNNQQRTYVFDIDGTICFDGTTIDNEILRILEVINRNSKIVLASARPIRDIIPIIKKYEFLNDIDLIGGNGVIVRKNGEIFSETIDANDVATIINNADKYNYSLLIDTRWDYFFNGDEDSKLFALIDADNLAHNIHHSKLKDVIKIVIMYQEFNYPFFASLKQKFNLNHYQDEQMFDILPKYINKYSSLQKYFGIDNYIAFGNDENDTELLQNATKGFCIGKKLNVHNITNIKREHLVQTLTLIHKSQD